MVSEDNPIELRSIERKLDQLIELVEDLIILQAAAIGITNEGIRKMVGVQSIRVSKIARLVPRD